MIDFSLCLLLLIVLAVCASSMLRVEKTLLSKCLRSDLSYPFSGISGFIATAVYFVAIVSSILCVCCRVLGYCNLMYQNEENKEEQNGTDSSQPAGSIPAN